MENYRNEDHTTRDFNEVAEIWLKNGIMPEKHLAFYCGTGWRGSEAWFNAWLMGWPRVLFMMAVGLNGATIPQILLKQELLLSTAFRFFLSCFYNQLN